MKQNPILDKIEAEQIRTLTEFNVGDTVRVHNKIKEGNRERIQMFEGTVMKIQNGGIAKTFTVRNPSTGNEVLIRGRHVKGKIVETSPEYCVVKVDKKFINFFQGEEIVELKK